MKKKPRSKDITPMLNSAMRRNGVTMHPFTRKNMFTPRQHKIHWIEQMRNWLAGHAVKSEAETEWMKWSVTRLDELAKEKDVVAKVKKPTKLDKALFNLT